MTLTRINTQDRQAETRAFQERYRSYLAAGDLAGLLANCYTADARLHSFRVRAEGAQPMREFLALYRRRIAELGVSTVEHAALGSDYIWTESNIVGAQEAVKLYEFQFLREGRIYLHLLGEKQGTVWQSGDIAGPTPEAGPMTHRLHQRYIAYQADGDADGLADGFFTPDARLITAKLQVEGREALRAFFRHKFQEEHGFHLESIRNITGADDYVWFEATAGGSQGMRTVYDVMLVRAGRVALQLVGTLQGILPANTNTR